MSDRLRGFDVYVCLGFLRTSVTGPAGKDLSAAQACVRVNPSTDCPPAESSSAPTRTRPLNAAAPPVSKTNPIS